MISRETQCGSQTCYEESIKTKGICKPSYDTAGQNYMSIIPISSNNLLILALTLWSCVVLLSIIELIFIQKRYKVTTADDKLALLLAAVLFSGGLFYLYKPRFDSFNFCLMNRNDPFCKGAETSCYKLKNSTVFAYNFGFGGFIEIESVLGFVLKSLY